MFATNGLQLIFEIASNSAVIIVIVVSLVTVLTKLHAISYDAYDRRMINDKKKMDKKKLCAKR